MAVRHQDPPATWEDRIAGARALHDMTDRPLGSVAGDPIPGRAAFSETPKYLYYARNLSRLRPRKVVAEAISGYRGRRISKEATEEFGLSMEELRTAGANELIYRFKEGLTPVDKVLFYDSRPFIIWSRMYRCAKCHKLYPPRIQDLPETHAHQCVDDQEYAGDIAKDEEVVAPRVPVHRGIWDLHVGNENVLDNVTGKVTQKEVTDEIGRVQSRWNSKNPCFEAGQDPYSEDAEPPIAYIELSRDPLPEVAVRPGTTLHIGRNTGLEL